MARRKTPTTRVDPSAFDRAGAQVFDNSLTTEIEDSYLEYAYSVIHSRALPDARDGLKPVHRRILFSMNEQGYRPTSAYVKSSRVVGDCFVRGALVSTPEGLRPIEEIEIGDHVLDGRGEPVAVDAVYENPVSELVRVTWSDGHSMLVTPGQRFRVDDGWTDARDLVGAHTTGLGAERHANLLADGGAAGFVLGLVVAVGVEPVAGRVRLELADEGPLDIAHGWAIAHDVTASREKIQTELRVRHVLTFAHHDGLLEATRGTPTAVLNDRTTWTPFLAGLFTAAGFVRDGREIVLPGGEPEYAVLADAGIRARRDATTLTITGRDAAALAVALLRWTGVGPRQDGLVQVIRNARHAADKPFPRVVSVEPVEPDTTYDIRVASDEHAFVVSGFVVHNCMGKYHPHGDTAIYDAMVRLAQDFSLNTPLVDGHGNFGSPDDGPAASRYCVVGDTRIRLADGASPRIADVVNLPADSEADADFEVLDKDGKAVRVDKVFNSGAHPTIRMTTESGFSLRGSENHLVLCLEAPMGVPVLQWRRLDELRPGAVVAVARNAWSRVVPTAQEHVLGVVGGAWVSEGFASGDRAGFSTTDEHFFAEVLHAYDQVVGGRRDVSERRTGRDRELVRELDVQDRAGGMEAFRNSPLAEFIGHRGRDAFVPEFVWNGGWGVKRAFLMAAFEGDGECREAPDGVTVRYTTRSPRLAGEVQELLAEFGVVAVRRQRRRPDGSVGHRLVVSGPRNVRAFAERVGFLATKQAGLSALPTHSPSTAHGSGADSVPFVADYVRGALDLDRRGSGRTWSTEHDFDRVERWETERPRIIEWIEDTEVLATILPVMDSGYRFEAVTGVEACEPAEVYSVRVDSEDHSFLAGGFVNHNTEARMSPAAMLLVGELDEETVDFRPNYDGSLQEPTVLPAAFPNLLVNGTSGIAVGMATNMIPHNLGEVVAAARHLVAHPDATLDELMEFIPGPDLPTGGVLLGLDEVRKAYETGRGVVRMRAKVETGLLEGSRGRQAITVTELPYGVGPEKIIEKITDEVTKSKRLTGIADVKDLTDRENGTRVVIECKVGVNPQALLSDLYRLTPMEQSFGINNLVLVEGQPRTLGLKALLEVFLEHRYEVVTRRTGFRRRKREDRLHLVEGLLKALLDIDKVIKLIRGSENAAAAKEGLVTTFELTEVQATYILDTPLRRLTRYDSIELEAEREKLRAEITELSRILDDPAVLKEVVSTELAKVAEDLQQERRTALLDGDLKEVLAASKPAGPLEVADDPCQVILSATGLVARTAAESEESSEARRRNGRTKHDAVAATVHTTARGQVLLVTNRGRAFKVDVLPLPVLPEQSGTVSLSGGMAAGELADLDAGEKVVGIAPLTDTESPGLALGTRSGTVKVCAPEWPVRSDEFEVITLKEGDEVVGATWLRDAEETLVFVSSDASLLRYPASLVRPQGLKGGGMAGINLGPDGRVVFFGAVRTDDDVHGQPMVVTSTGLSVKVTPFAAYPAKGRATGGVRAHRFLKGETGLALAWVGPRPAGAAATGSPVELPAVDERRDGSGHAHPGPDVVGHLVERD